MLLHRDPTCSKLWAEALLRGRFAGHLQKCNLPKNYTGSRGILCRGYCRKSSAPCVPAGSLLPSHRGLQGQGTVFLNAGSEAACALPCCSAPARRTQGPAWGEAGGGHPAGGTPTPSAPSAATHCHGHSRQKRASKPALLPWFIPVNCLTQGNQTRLHRCFNTHYGLKNP